MMIVSTPCIFLTVPKANAKRWSVFIKKCLTWRFCLKMTFKDENFIDPTHGK